MTRTFRVFGRLAAVASATILVACGSSQDFGKLLDGERLPRPAALVIEPPPGVATSNGPTLIEMMNVDFHVDDDIRLGVRSLSGTISRAGGGNPVLDQKSSLVITVSKGVMHLTSRDLTLLINRYAFGYPGAPIKNLMITTAGTRLVLKGTLHKIVDLPFTITADPSVTPEGLIRLRTATIKVLGIDGFGLLKAVGRKLDYLLDVSKAHGVQVVGNDLLLDPLAILPPPKIVGHLTTVHVAANDFIQTFGSSTEAPIDAVPPRAARNYIYFRGGNLQFGKLLMLAADLMVVDTDASDPFDFYLDFYLSQLVAGYNETLPSKGLVVWMPDFDDLGTPRAAVPRVTH